MTIWNPEYRIKINNVIKTSVTLSGLTISSGRTDIYSQAVAGYCNLNLIETNKAAIDYEINDAVTIEVKDSSGNYVILFGGFITDVTIQIQTPGSTALSQRINIIALGALARLTKAIYVGNLSQDQDGDQMYQLLENLLLNSWNEVPAAQTWSGYNPIIQWQDAENTGLGEIDRPGDYDLDSQNNLDDTIYNIASRIATSGLGYLYEDSQGRISYADSTHRSSYWSNNGFVELNGNEAYGTNLAITKKAGDVRNKITIAYTSSGNSVHTEEDADSISRYGQLATSILTTLKNQTDAEQQALFYLALRAYPQFQLKTITFPVGSTEIDDVDRDSLLNVFMGMPVKIVNLPPNMVDAQFEGFVEGWTWIASLGRLDLAMTVSPLAFSLQTYKWLNVDIAETWNTISNTLEWEDATIVA